MVRRQSTVKRAGPRRRAVEPTPRHEPTVFGVPPATVKSIKTRLGVAGCKLQAAGRVAGRFTRSSLREVTGAMKASREPMTMLWRNVRLAGRHIVRDATAAWHELVPAATGAQAPCSGGPSPSRIVQQRSAPTPTPQPEAGGRGAAL
jgi:hypothetical protein